MPDSSLETMCIKRFNFDGLYDSGFTDEKEDLATWIKNQMDVEEDEYMFLQVTKSAPRRDRSFILKASEPTTTCKLVSKKQFNANVGSWPRIQVKCKSLKSLTISLRSVETTIDLRENRPVEDVADWNFVKKPSDYPRPRVYKRDSILVRMRKEKSLMEEYFEREAKRDRNLERYGVSDSEDYEGSDYSRSEDDNYYLF